MIHLIFGVLITFILVLIVRSFYDYGHRLLLEKNIANLQEYLRFFIVEYNMDDDIMREWIEDLSACETKSQLALEMRVLFKLIEEKLTEQGLDFESSWAEILKKIPQ